MAAERAMGSPTRVSLVLGSGGARGLAHIGVIEALDRAGFEIVSIAGSSMGALVGGIHAAGRLARYRDWALSLERSGVLRLLDFAFGHPGLIKGDRVIAVLRELVGEHAIEELPIRFTAVATDLAAQREVWLTEGPLFDAIRASIAIPMLFTPHRISGRELVDGGLLAPLPLAATRQTHADLVIAVDVNDRVARGLEYLRTPKPASELPAQDEAEPDDSLKARFAQIMEGLFERKPAEPPQPGLMDLMSRSLDTMQAQLSRLRLALDPPDVLVRVPRDACMFHEFWRARELIDLGAAATERALQAARAQVDGHALRS
jgi:NTE family protein